MGQILCSRSEVVVNICAVPPDIPELPHAILAAFLPSPKGKHLKSHRICSTFGKNLWLFFDFSWFLYGGKNNHCNITWRRDNAGLQKLSPAHHIHPPCCDLCTTWHVFFPFKGGKLHNCDTVLGWIIWFSGLNAALLQLNLDIFPIWCSCTSFERSL